MPSRQAAQIKSTMRAILQLKMLAKNLALSIFRRKARVKKFCENEQSGYFEEKNLAVFDQTRRWLDLYFSGREPGFTPALNPVGTAFRRAVWEILLKIPYGQTMTYGQIAREIAAARGLANMSAQAVGGAVGHNEISIIIPCHRVIGAHGNLTGYAGGIDRKIKLLKLEGIDMQGLFTPAKGTAL